MVTQFICNKNGSCQIKCSLKEAHIHCHTTGKLRCIAIKGAKCVPIKDGE